MLIALCVVIVMVGLLVAIIYEAHLPPVQQRFKPEYDRHARDSEAS